MIGFILGTSEGKKILSLINEYTEDIAITTATNYGGELLKKFKFKSLNTKPLNKENMIKWIKENKIKILVDASHPYAKEVTNNAIECSKELKINYVRYERLGALEEIQGEDIIRVKNYEEAIELMKSLDGNVLNTTGSNNISKFLDINFNYRVLHRILPSYEVLRKIIQAGVKIEDIIALKGPISYELEKAFINQYNIKAVLTKDSGIQGGVLEKLKAVRECNIKLIVIENPKFKYDLEFNNEEDLIKYLISKLK
ncbi:cobalt-precorrin-6A reductase [Clostridium weizhouense]|uniref:Cobalt-precorrin-6A reductase n=1 Tax=Clostridium weizhouense TaxID=2859781 RepID=A0ABS7AKR8_9CLOT|nr:cobalt-precorrin-6A reductase [Clostridium weizhouense]MBW6409227.1 cobalt-precorrin-6A reductase [Clostridium weizhouense]